MHNIQTADIMWSAEAFNFAKEAQNFALRAFLFRKKHFLTTSILALGYSQKNSLARHWI